MINRLQINALTINEESVYQLKYLIRSVEDARYVITNVTVFGIGTSTYGTSK